jgi:hypothetical protein
MGPVGITGAAGRRKDDPGRVHETFAGFRTRARVALTSSIGQRKMVRGSKMENRTDTLDPASLASAGLCFPMILDG